MLRSLEHQKGFARGERVHAVLTLSVAQSFPSTMLPARRSRPSILDNTRASNANASLSCLCTVFVIICDDESDWNERRGFVSPL